MQKIISAFLISSLAVCASVPPAAVGEENRQDEGVRVKLDYIFSGETSDVEVRMPPQLPSNLVRPPEAAVEAVPETDFVVSDSTVEREREPDDYYDYVGDHRGESGIASDQPVWQGANAETLVKTRTHSYAGAHGASRTSIDDGYIPEYDESLKLEDSAPESVSQTYSNQGGRMPSSWAVPPGAGEGSQGGNSDSDYAAYANRSDYQYYSGGDRGSYYPESNYLGSRSSYPGSTYYSQRAGNVHHPEGPYGYGFGVQDPFWDLGPTYYGDAGYEFDSGWSVLSGFDPELAHLKAGPLYLQFVSVEVGALYSDYDGPAVFRPGEEDGWLGYISLRMRAAARITPNFYFTLDGEVIYVFGANGIGIRSAVGSPFLTLDYVTQWGMWDVRIYDRLGTAFPFAFNIGDAYKRAGRYSFGFLGYGRSNYLFDPVIYNTIGIQGTRLVSPTWRVSLEADHTDFFYVGSNQNNRSRHRSRQHLGAEYASVIGAVPFNPYFRYDAYHESSNTSYWQHTFYIGGSEQISESLHFDAKVGYFWQTGNRSTSSTDRWLWEIGLRHKLSELTSHGIRAGQNFFTNDIWDDSVVSTYLHYYLNHQLTERLRFYGFAQWSNDEFITGRLVGGEYQSEIYGARLFYELTERTTTQVGYRVEHRENTATRRNYERSIFDARIDCRLAYKTTGYLLYRYEKDNFFDEDVVAGGVRRYF